MEESLPRRNEEHEGCKKIEHGWNGFDGLSQILIAAKKQKTKKLATEDMVLVELEE